ncbi:MAG: hypothetical protein R2684_02495 [Pyrinomonadaceae bacterium]
MKPNARAGSICRLQAAGRVQPQEQEMSEVDIDTSSGESEREEAPKSLPELEDKIWAVLSFEDVIGSSLTYDEASEMIRVAETKRLSGLCVVTNDVAAKVRALGKNED